VKEVNMTERNLAVDLSGKTAIVTGASRGIGKAISLALAQAGAKIIIAARSEKESPSLPGTIYKTAEEIEDLGGHALPVRCDVTAIDEVENMVELTIGNYTTIDILVNNAGMLAGSNFQQTEMGEFRSIWETNVLGPFLCTRTVLPHMIARKSGSIVNISSGLAQSENPHNNIYSASKAALDRMMIKLASEVAEYNIAVNLIYPGMIASEGMLVRIPKEMADQLPRPSIMGPPVTWLAAQKGDTFTGKIVQAGTFGTEWP
jgi:NAD(P)-dependent dehydrogenase (short-subunit alcohol dehydrogenase family)